MNTLPGCVLPSATSACELAHGVPGASCKKLKKDMTGLAKKLARQWNQESAMLTLWCADGPVDVSWPMPRYRKWTRQKRESPRKRGSGA